MLVPTFSGGRYGSKGKCPARTLSEAARPKLEWRLTSRRSLLRHASPLQTDIVETEDAEQASVPDDSSLETLAAIAEALQWNQDRPFVLQGAVNNVVEHRRSLTSKSELGREEVSEAQEEGQIEKKGRGRPKGYKAWNQGLSMPEKTKMKIAATQKKRWQNTSFKEHQSDVHKGRTPWNKGLSPSLGARQKMSAAKLFTVLPKSMQCKMSRSHQGLSHSEETRALLSQKLKGKAKSEDHKKAIASGQRRRFEAMRIQNYLQACDNSDVGNSAYQEPVELANVDLEEDLHEEGGLKSFMPFPESSTPNMYSTTEQTRAKKKQPGRGDANNAVLQDFVAQLREFRCLQRELAPWTDKFKALHGRRPRFEDVEAAGIGWLVEKYEEYASARQKLLCESSQLRSRLEASPPSSLNSLGAHNYSTKMSLNSSPSASAIEGAKRMAKAMEYKQTPQRPLETASEIPSLDVPRAIDELTAHHGLDEMLEQGFQQILDGRKARKEAELPDSDPTESGPSNIVQKASAKAPNQEPKVNQVNKECAKNLSGASPRVRSAMLAAAKYKKNKGS